MSVSRSSISSNGSTLLERSFRDSTAQLTPSGLYISSSTGGSAEKSFIALSDIFACEIQKKHQTCRAGTSTELVIHAYVLRVSAKKVVQRETVIVDLKFDGADAPTEAREWEQMIMSLSGRSRQRFLVFINPNSGAGKAKEIFHKTVEPMFSLAGVEYDVKVTERPNYAHDYVHEDAALSSYTGVILCGGDGLMYEVVNGLAGRKDWLEVAERLTFGIVPCGSGNGLVATMNGNLKGDPLVSASLAIVRNNTSKMDLVRVNTSTKTYHSFLSITWGYMACVDIRSEAIKSWAGNARFTIWALKDLFLLKTYKAVVSYLPLDSDAEVPSLTHPLSDEWHTVEDKFVGVTAAYQSHLSPDLHFAPDSTLNDGIIWLLMIRSTVSRIKFLNFLLRLESGTHIPRDTADPDIQMIKCRAVRIVPQCKDGCIAVDGEEINFGPLQAEIIPSIANVFVPINDTITHDKTT